MNPTRLLPLFVTAALALPLALPAADGRIPISSVPFTISQPGYYYLTQDLSLAVTSSTMITVSASNVTLDLNGHTLTQSSTGVSYGISAGNINRFDLGNGRLISSSFGLDFFGGGSNRDIHIHDLLIDGTQFPINIGSAILNVVIERCRIWNVAGTLIRLTNVTNGAVLDNTLYTTGTNSSGVDATGTNLEIAGNRIYGGGGITMSSGSGAAIHDNTIRGVAGAVTGINLAGVTASVIENNHISTSFSTGISLSGNANNNVLRGNDITNTATGMAIAGSTGDKYSGTRTAGVATPYNVAGGNTDGGDNQ